MLGIARTISLRSTCARRQVGAVLVDWHGCVIGVGHNGVPRHQRHCVDHPCAGADQAAGFNLASCEAVHAEANSLLFCRSINDVHTCYTTVSPCLDCVKLLLQTPCRRIVFIEPYAHDQPASERWLRQDRIAGLTLRTWEHHPLG